MKSVAARILIFFVVILTTLAVLIYINADRIIFYFISRSANINISYSQIKNHGSKAFDFTDLTVIDKKTGVGFLAKNASINSASYDIFSGKVSFDFKLNDVNFTKWAPESADDYSTLPGLIAVPFSSKWRYGEITGGIRMTKTGIRLEKLFAASDVIKLSISGIVQKNSDIDADITIYFSNALFAKIPENFVKMVLKNENDGWQSISVKLTGNYQIPSIEISSKTFRLNIGLLKEQK